MVWERHYDYVALLGRLDDFRKIGVPIQCDVDDARLLQGFHNRKAKIIKGDICEERGHRRLMRDEGETKLTPQEQSLNEEIEKLQDQWPYLMNEIFFIDYLKNPTYERGLAAKSKICKQTFGDCKANQTKVLEHKGNVTTRTKDRTKLVSYIECDTNKSPRQHEVTLGIVVIWRLFTDSEKSSLH